MTPPFARFVRHALPCAAALAALQGCSSAPVTPGEAPPSTEETPPDGGGGDDAIEEPPPPPERPEPQSNIRSCGNSGTKSKPLDVKSSVLSVHPAPLGGRMLNDRPTSDIWASGEVSRSALAPTHMSGIAPDWTASALLSRLQVKPFSPSGGVFYNAVSAEQAKVAFVDPSTTILTFASAWSQQEVGWNIAHPKRTPKTSNVQTDRFVRTVVPTRFVGYQFVLILASDCIVGALSDAVGRRALLTDGTYDIGIFDDARRESIEKVLVENDASIQLRVLTNKPRPELDALLAKTTCATGAMAACKALAKELFATSQALTPSPPSDLAKVQTDTDPHWSVTEVLAPEVAILE